MVQQKIETFWNHFKRIAFKRAFEQTKYQLHELFRSSNLFTHFHMFFNPFAYVTQEHVKEKDMFGVRVDL